MSASQGTQVGQLMTGQVILLRELEYLTVRSAQYSVRSMYSATRYRWQLQCRSQHGRKCQCAISFGDTTRAVPLSKIMKYIEGFSFYGLGNGFSLRSNIYVSLYSDLRTKNSVVFRTLFPVIFPIIWIRATSVQCSNSIG